MLNDKELDALDEVLSYQLKQRLYVNYGFLKGYSAQLDGIKDLQMN